MPEFPGTEAAGLQTTIERLRRCELIDYAGVAQAKLTALRLAYDRFRTGGDTVITSYSIHYTKLYDDFRAGHAAAQTAIGQFVHGH